jgi:hypothetical protein
MTRRLNIDGDGQGDLAGHGGEHRAVFVYQIRSYRYWQNQLGRNDFTYGQFGENFTVEGLADTEVCIGDHYRIGDALFEVTQPRVTCYRLGIRMNEPQMAALLVSHGRPGSLFPGPGRRRSRRRRRNRKGRGGSRAGDCRRDQCAVIFAGSSGEQARTSVAHPALSAGWRTSLEALLDRERKGSGTTGNPGLGPRMGPPPAWQGFRPLRVSRKLHESSNVTSLVLQPADGEPLRAALAGQFIVLRLRPRTDESALLRSYSLSGAPSEDRYRISIKREPHGTAGAYIDTRVQAGDTLDVSAPRGSFTLRQGSVPWSLSAPASAPQSLCCGRWPPRNLGEIWWIRRNSSEHPLRRRCVISSDAQEAAVHSLQRTKANRPADCRFRQGGARGCRCSGKYRCGLLHLRSAAFMSGLVDGLAGWACPSPPPQEFRTRRR